MMEPNSRNPFVCPACAGLLVMMLMSGCLGKSWTTDPGTQGVATAEHLVFLATVQGNPLCVVVSTQQVPVPRRSGEPKTRWEANAWMVLPGTSKRVYADRGKAEKESTTPLTLTEDNLLFTSDKDRFVFYHPSKADEFLLVTDPIFPDRVRGGGDEETKFGLQSATFYWNGKRIDGRFYYGQRNMGSNPDQEAFLPLTGLRSEGKAYLLWSPGGGVLYLEEQSDGGKQGRSFFAVMQDARGKWEETYDLEFTEPACAFTSSPCQGAAAKFRLNIPLWQVEGAMARMNEAHWPLEGVVEKDQTGTTGGEGKAPGRRGHGSGSSQSASGR